MITPVEATCLALVKGAGACPRDNIGNTPTEVIQKLIADGLLEVQFWPNPEPDGDPYAVITDAGKDALGEFVASAVASMPMRLRPPK